MRFSKFTFITFTVTTATPAVFTSTAHELAEGDKIRLETTGTLPTGLSLLTDYWVVYNGMTADTFQVATSKGGSPLATTADGSGAHTWIKRNVARLTPSSDNNLTSSSGVL